MVTPIYYVFFTTFVILASSILYKEWSCLGASDVIGNVIGFLTTIIGIFQMQLFRDVDIPLKRFRILMHSGNMGGHVELVNSATSLVNPENGGRSVHTYSNGTAWRGGNSSSSDSDNSRSNRAGNVLYT